MELVWGRCILRALCALDFLSDGFFGFTLQKRFGSVAGKCSDRERWWATGRLRKDRCIGDDEAGVVEDFPSAVHDAALCAIRDTAPPIGWAVKTRSLGYFTFRPDISDNASIAAIAYL